MALRDGGPPAVYWAGRPRSGRESMAQLPFGQLVEINTNKTFCVTVFLLIGKDPLEL